MKTKFDYRTIKTFEDACLKLGADPQDFYLKYEGYPEHIKALIKLEVITKALNDGWSHPLDGETIGYYPWYWICNDSEIAGMTEKEKNDRRMVTYIRQDGSCGLAFARSDRAWSFSTAYFGSRLACKSKEIALYCAIEFKDIWASYFFPQPDLKEVLNGMLW